MHPQRTTMNQQQQLKQLKQQQLKQQLKQQEKHQTPPFPRPPPSKSYEVVVVSRDYEIEGLHFVDMTCAHVVEIMRNRYGDHNVGADSHCVEEQPDDDEDDFERPPRRMAPQERLSAARGKVRFVEAGARPPEMRGYRPPSCWERLLLGRTDADARREAVARARRHAEMQMRREAEARARFFRRRSEARMRREQLASAAAETTRKSAAAAAAGAASPPPPTPTAARRRMWLAARLGGEPSIMDDDGDEKEYED